MASEDWNMKWKTSWQDNLVLALHLTRKYKGRPTEEQFKEMKLVEHNARESLMYWSSDSSAGWDKVHSEMPLDQSKVEEQNKHLEAGISAEDSE